MSRVAVKRELLRWARERSGLEAADLVERFPKYEAWESGDEQATFRQLEKIARKTLTPFGYFFLSEPPEEKLPIPDFRTLRDRYSDRVQICLRRSTRCSDGRIGCANTCRILELIHWRSSDP